MSDYTIYKKNVIEALRYLSSKELQLVTWFPNDQGLSSSFKDDVEDVFDDFFLERALYDNGVIVFDTNSDKALRELNDACEIIGYDKNGDDLIDAPEMQLVREKAAIALALILASDGSESTVEIIEE